MPDLTKVYNAFDVEKPLPADDDVLYVDLASARGAGRISRKLRQRIRNAHAGGAKAHDLVMGHTKCGKTTELNRTARLLEEDDYVTVSFDVADVATRTFEYTTVLLFMAGQIVGQLTEREPPIEVEGTSAEKLLEFLREREITLGGQTSGDATVKADAKLGFLTNLLGQIGIGAELRGGFQRSRDITVKIEADTGGFMKAIKDLVRDANEKVVSAGKKGLVVICDGCDKLDVNAADENGNSYDLQYRMFVDHADDLRAVPCHVIYTVPISITAHLGDIWEQNPEFVPAIPVNELPGIDARYPTEGRRALKEVVEQRLKQEGTSIEELFDDQPLFESLTEVSGGHISDLLLLVRGAVLEAQIEGMERLTRDHTDQSISSRTFEYTRLVETKYLEILVTIDQYKRTPASSEAYRELIFKRLALEYVCGRTNCVDLHPLVAASEAYQRFRQSRSA